MSEALAILEKVNAFYANAWTQLITFSMVIFGLVGVVVPIIVQIIQNRTFKTGQEEVIKKISSEMDEKYKAQEKAMKEEYVKSLEDIKTNFKEIESKLKKEIACTRAGAMQIQGNQEMAAGDFGLAIGSFSSAVVDHMFGDDELNLNRVLQSLISGCLPKVKAKDFEAHDNLDPFITSIIDCLKENNTNGKYTDRISEIKRLTDAAKKVPA